MVSKRLWQLEQMSYEVLPIYSYIFNFWSIIVLNVSLWYGTYFMMTSSNENIFGATGPLCGKSLVTGEFPSQRPVTRSFDVFFDLCPSKRSRRWWFEKTPRSLWCHCNVIGFMWSISFKTGCARYMIIKILIYILHLIQILAISGNLG